MKFLLAAINAKYIHSNLGVYSLKRYAQSALGQSGGAGQEQAGLTVDIGEYTINQPVGSILTDIYGRKPDSVGFSCYIWNIRYVMELVRDLHKVLPGAKIWLGGPEVSYCAVNLLEREPDVAGVMKGEGEAVFAGLLKALLQEGGEQEDMLASIPGLSYRDQEGRIHDGGTPPLMDLDQLPFAYDDYESFDLDHRIVYYETSRGCPFSCSYCLSSIDKQVRFRSLSLVRRELQFFLDRKIPQVKLVDRTFNCKKSHAMEIWRYILEHDNGVTNFHFEISADLLDEEELELIGHMRPGLIQLEIGVQTTNPRTLQAIRRRMDLGKLTYAVEKINSFHNTHQHLDLIVGLPYEDYESFGRSFDQVYALKPEQLQMGFLKVLKGSYMMETAPSYRLLYRGEPPYEVLSTKWLGFRDTARLKAVEEMVEVYYNSGQFKNTLDRLVGEFETAFSMFEELAGYYEEQGLSGVSHSRPARYEILFTWITGVIRGREEEWRETAEEYRDFITFDFYLRENAKSRPGFARDLSPYRDQIREFYKKEAAKPRYLQGYEAYDSRQISKMTHVEVMRDKTFVLLDYRNRDALLGNAKAFYIPAASICAEST